MKYTGLGKQIYHTICFMGRLTLCLIIIKHCGLMTARGDIAHAQHWFRKWPVAWEHQPINRTIADLSLNAICSIPQELVTNLFCRLCDGDYLHNYNISRILVGHKIVDHSDIVGAAPALLQLHLHSRLNTWLASLDWAKTTSRRDEKHLSFVIWYAIYDRFDSVLYNYYHIPCGSIS